MDSHRSVGFLVFIIFTLSLALIPGVSAFDGVAKYKYQPWYRELPAEFVEIVPADYPSLTGTELVPEITAESVMIIDVDSKVPIYTKNVRQQLFPASTTKLLTALVALDNYALDEVITMPAVEAYPSVMGLKVGEHILVRDALYGLLIASGNDAAYALADHFPGGYAEFVLEMDRYAQNLGMVDTQIQNPSGLPQSGHVTTSRDLAHLTAYAMQNQFIADTVKIQSRVVYGTRGERHVLRTTNQLLGEVVGLKGGKTGFTDEAGEVLASYVERNGRRIVVVVLKSKDRFGESEQLIEWIYRNISYETIVPESNR